MAYPHLFEPIDVGPLTIPNRIVRTAHGTMLTGERLIAYHEARAAGGVGMSTLEATGVHANAPSLTPLHSDEVSPLDRAPGRRAGRYCPARWGTNGMARRARSWNDSFQPRDANGGAS